METNLLLIGKVVGAHGVNGYLKIKFWGEEEQKNWEKVHIPHGEGCKTFEIEDFKFHKGFVLLKIKNISTRDQALQLKGSEVFIDKKELSGLSDEEYYWFELEGLDVYTQQGDFIGTIQEILPTGSNDVYIVRDGEKEHLIPGIKDVVISVDKKKKRMVINPVEGLL
jgi:16S rRNA processing protein RimM